MAKPRSRPVKGPTGPPSASVQLRAPADQLPLEERVVLAKWLSALAIDLITLDDPEGNNDWMGEQKWFTSKGVW